MAEVNVTSGKREFRCGHCNGLILIPFNLPPTTGPCPHCGGIVTSPALENPVPAMIPLPAAPAPTAVSPVAPSLPPIQGIPVAPKVETPVAASVVPPVPAPVIEQPKMAEVPVAALPTGLAAVPVSRPVEVPAPPVDQPKPAVPAKIPEPRPVVSDQVPAPLVEQSKPAVPAKIPEPRQVVPDPVPAPAAVEAKVQPSSPIKDPALEPPPTPKERAALRAQEVVRAEDPSHANHRRKPGVDSKGKKAEKSGLIPVLIILWLMIVGAGVGVYFVTREMGRDTSPLTVPNSELDSKARESNYIRSGWKKDAYAVLGEYLSGTSASDKLPHILNSENLAGTVEDFYGGGVINDGDTPAEAFSVYELPENDRRRGLFMMVYDQPPQFEMKEFFRPLASLEVQYGIEEADLLLSTLARAGNFAMEPLRVHAFFKRTPDGLKLDWETFAQTKYRTFRSFVGLPEVGLTGTFRVFVAEDVPDKNRLEMGTRTYRVADPANTSDTARVNVKVDSEVGRALSLINWRNTKEAVPINKTATVELKWSGDASDPHLEISRFICWEFLGLGGDSPDPTVSAH